jgi:hypothetical protein
MSKLIIVCNEEHADKIVPFNSELDFAKKIPVYGKFLKKKLIMRSSTIYLPFLLENSKQQYFSSCKSTFQTDDSF